MKSEADLIEMYLYMTHRAAACGLALVIRNGLFEFDVLPSNNSMIFSSNGGFCSLREADLFLIDYEIESRA